METETRNLLRNTVTACRRLLEEAVGQRLEGEYGLHANGTIEDAAKLAHLSVEDAAYRGQLVDHYRHIAAAGIKRADAMAQLVREIAFTHLNRLCAYKMMERRGLIREAVSRGQKSQGFMFYLADHPEDQAFWTGGQADRAYRHYLNWLGATYADEIPALFSPTDAANRLYPPQRVLDQVLELINAPALDGIWTEDEAIGWVYQYFTPKELREQARKESAAPRNSYELAFRNQFYTPRYVVEFLTDNTLGRIWYEMRQGQTSLAERCRYLVRRPHEVFMAPDEAAPAQPENEALSQEELLQQPLYIPFRAPKDPRQITMLDPAGGSGHFALYCFDLYEVIYREAYDAPDLGAALRRDYPDRETFLRAVPALILEHNLHLIDIDPRACQIAALALWLRAQRAYQELGIPRDERPKITKAHVVCAEPMPGDRALLDEYLTTVDPRLRPLVQTIWEKMQLAGEAGSLLKIEDEIAAALREGRTVALVDVPPVQMTLYQADQPPRQMVLELATADERAFWERAEGRLLAALRDYSRHATNGQGLRRQLFAEDAEQGLTFIDLCRERYDVVLMNPPFGEASERIGAFVDSAFGNVSGNILCAFIRAYLDRASPGSLVGSVVDKTILIKNSYEAFRKDCFFQAGCLSAAADFGWGVLDANVEVSSVIISHANTASSGFVFGANLSLSEDKAVDLQKECNSPTFLALGTLRKMPFTAVSLQVPPFFLRCLERMTTVNDSVGAFYNGHTIKSDVFKRLSWEVPLRSRESGWDRMWNGSEYSPFYVPLQEVVLTTYYAGGLAHHPSTIIRNARKHKQSGLCLGKRGDYLDVQVLPQGFVLTNEGFGGPFEDTGNTWRALSLLNSRVVQYMINLYCGQHKGVGYIGTLPIPDAGGEHDEQLEDLGRKLYDAGRRANTSLETDPGFTSPRAECLTHTTALQHFADAFQTALGQYHELAATLDELALHVYGVSEEESDSIATQTANRPQAPLLLDWPSDGEQTSHCYFAVSFLSYCVGCTIGRWDARIALNSELAPQMGDPFAPLPVCPPGMLVGPDGLPATPGRIVSEEWLRVRPDAITLPSEGSVARPTIPDAEYPLRLAWEGILVDDPDHPDDIVRRTRDVLALLWGERAEAIEQEACEILGVAELRDYFRKPAKGGFWDDHVKRYSKSRRKAPIYWLLQSSKKNYALWLYYHRLDGDIIFKALVNDVEPKVRLEESRLEGLRGELHASGATGAEARRLEREIVRQEAFVSELVDFCDKLHRAADLRLTPDLNDGVVLNIAPLWELVPWKVAKEYWDALLAGQYEWSSIGKQLREKGMVK